MSGGLIEELAKSACRCGVKGTHDAAEHLAMRPKGDHRDCGAILDPEGLGEAIESAVIGEGPAKDDWINDGASHAAIDERSGDRPATRDRGDLEEREVGIQRRPLIEPIDPAVDEALVVACEGHERDARGDREVVWKRQGSTLEVLHGECREAIGRGALGSFGWHGVHRASVGIGRAQTSSWTSEWKNRAMRRRFFEVDVFGRVRLTGNPLAVVLDAGALSGEAMQQFAAWTNFSETTFLVPPTSDSADYGVRIFTTTTELPFAGHPTLGSARAWLASGAVPLVAGQLTQECGVGLVTVEIDAEESLRFAAPDLRRFEPLASALRREIEESLGLDPSQVVDASWVDNGPGWIGLLLASAHEVRAVVPGELTHPVGIVGPLGEGEEAAYEVRAFFPEAGKVLEDPVTGSLHASIAKWHLERGWLSAPFLAVQGSQVGRDGVISISEHHGQLFVGGAARVVVDGLVEVADL